jgi:RNA polymerase sigma-70 factor (ECF subfamily)
MNVPEGDDVDYSERISMRKRIATDDELMQDTSEGDETAFAELVRRHRDWVSALAFAFMRDSDQAEDVTQEAFCRVHQRAGDYTPQGSFVAWLKRITVNLAKDFLRKQRQAALVPLREEEVSIVVPFDPTAALLAEGLREDVRAAIQSLPDPLRLALVMRYFGDMSVPDIAWAMQCPEGTVKSRLFYGLERVRQTLTAHWEQEHGGLKE